MIAARVEPTGICARVLPGNALHGGNSHPAARKNFGGWNDYEFRLLLLFSWLH